MRREKTSPQTSATQRTYPLYCGVTQTHTHNIHVTDYIHTYSCKAATLLGSNRVPKWLATVAQVWWEPPTEWNDQHRIGQTESQTSQACCWAGSGKVWP